jgi:UDP-glucose 4-epimerase
VKANKSKSRLVNVQGTLNLAERALSFGVSRFVFASTSHVYAQSQNPLKESSPLSPISIYAEQKLEAEEGLTKLFKRSGAELVVIRIFSVLDWGTKFHTLGGLVGRIANGQADLLVSNGDDVRDFLTPSKIAHCLDRIAGEENMTGIWNLGSGRALSVKSAVQVMLESKGFLNPEKFVLSGNSDLPYVVGDIGKIQKQIPSLKLYWEPRNSTRISNEPSGIS